MNRGVPLTLLVKVTPLLFISYGQTLAFQVFQSKPEVNFVYGGIRTLHFPSRYYQTSVL